MLRIGSDRTVPRTVRPLDPAGERVSFPHTPFLRAVVEAAIFFDRPTWPAASKTNASWPAHQLGRAGEVVYCREEKVGNGMVFLLLFPKDTYLRPQPAQPVGGPLRAFRCEGRRPGIPSEVQPPPHNPTREGGPGGGTSSPGGSFPHFFPRNGAPAGQAKVPCRSNGVGTKPQGCPAREGQVPARSNGAEKNAPPAREKPPDRI